MPVISIFFGILIRMYHAAHNPPHIHIQYGEFKAIMEISTGKILEGRLPPRIQKLVNEWRKSHIAELKKAWHDAQLFKQLKRIKPLE